MKNDSYWEKKMDSYVQQGLHLKPNPFAIEVLGYLPEQGTILELGTGTGQDARFFADQGFKVTATDLNTKTAEKFSENYASQIVFKQVDISEILPFDDNVFDTVYAHLSIHYFTEETTKRVFSEIHRVLKANGILACLVNTSNDPEIKEFDYTEIETNYYDNKMGLKKRYFSVESMKDYTDRLFEPILLDSKGTTNKDKISELIRFVGKKR